MAIAILDASKQQKQGRGREARWLYAIAFVYFLIPATLARLLPRSMRPDLIHAHEGKSIFGEASEAATSVVGFAYMK